MAIKRKNTNRIDIKAYLELGRYLNEKAVKNRDGLLLRSECSILAKRKKSLTGYIHVLCSLNIDMLSRCIMIHQINLLLFFVSVMVCYV